MNMMTAKSKTEKLTLIEHLPIVRIAPAMKPTGLISRKNFLRRYELMAQIVPLLLCG
jgi:hypothetical protein